MSLPTIESNAKDLGFHTLYLYSDLAEGLYLKSGWSVRERFRQAGYDMVLMAKDLAPVGSPVPRKHGLVDCINAPTCHGCTGCFSAAGA